VALLEFFGGIALIIGLLTRLAALGVEVRAGRAARGDLDEKLAVACGRAWVGSANATYARGPSGDQRDWGTVTRSVRLVDGLRASFERNWTAARPPPDTVGRAAP
jgi:hypothetical protein